MNESRYLFAVPTGYAHLLPDQWFNHLKLNRDKEEVIDRFRHFEYALVYLTCNQECLVYFRSDSYVHDCTVYDNPEEIKQVVFNTLMEYE